MPKRKLLVSLFLIFAPVFLSGCLVAKPANVQTESPDVTLSGTITKAGTQYSLTTSERQVIILDSRQVDLTPYANQNVTVTGQYSGTTLFVSKIQ